jgi:hypothetical protein
MGARRRASRQMKNEIPPSTTSAPIAIAATLPPLRPLLDPDVEVLGLMIVGVVAVGIVAAGCGRPGASGFDGPGVGVIGLVDPWARAVDGRANAAVHRTAIAAGASRPRTNLRQRLLHRRRLGGVDVRVLLGDVLLVVDALGVHRPDVVAGARQDVLDRAYRRQHRVI